MSAEPETADFWYVVVNASDPERHEVGWCATPEYAERLADGMHADHGFIYEVEEHTGGKGCPTCEGRTVAVCWRS